MKSHFNRFKKSRYLIATKPKNQQKQETFINYTLTPDLDYQLNSKAEFYATLPEPLNSENAKVDLSEFHYYANYIYIYYLDCDADDTQTGETQGGSARSHSTAEYKDSHFQRSWASRYNKTKRSH